MISFKPFPEFSTERLILRQLIPEDENEIFFFRSDERILKYLDIPKAKNIDDARKFIKKINKGIKNNEWIYWGITLKNNNKLIGTICIWNISVEENKADIGYVLHPDFQGKGFMQEAVIKVVDFGFMIMKLDCIEADFAPANLQSRILLEKNGFVLARKYENTEIYSLFNKL